MQQIPQLAEKWLTIRERTGSLESVVNLVPPMVQKYANNFI
jgi:hypothetical protein